MSIQLQTAAAFDLDELAIRVAELRRNGQRIVHCHGVFDLLHPGHLQHLRAARELGDALIVTVTPDRYVNKGPGRPVFNERLRAEALAALAIVDGVAVNRWPAAVETIRLLKPDLFVKGSEFADGADVTGHIAAEEAAAREVGTRLQFTEGEVFSSTRLLNDHFSPFPPETEKFLCQFRRRYTADDVIERLRALKNLRVLVVGDAILDEYCRCEPVGRASKSTAINARYESTETHLGGALAIANHVAGFAETVDLVSCLGETDSREAEIAAGLKPIVTPKFFYKPNAPTTRKRRYTATFRNTQLFQLSVLDDSPLPATLQSDVARHLAEAVADYDLVLVADYGHGFLGEPCVDALCQPINTKSCLAVNTQTNSANAGFNLATRYPRADYLCLDEAELRLACGDRYGPLEALTRQTAKQMQCGQLSVTKGSRGALVWDDSSGDMQHVPALTDRVVDTTGAGDAYLSLSALCAAAGYPADLIAFIGNCAGGIAAGCLGNRESVEPVPLFRFCTTLLK